MVAPDASFMINFKQSLLSSSQYKPRGDRSTHFTFDDNMQTASNLAPMSLGTATSAFPPENSEEDQRSVLRYPLMLWAEFPSLPSGELLTSLLHEFYHNFAPATPFFLSWARLSGEAPPYLVVAMALLGAAVAEEVHLSSWVGNLWRASWSLVLGALEVDNSLSRNAEWVQAVSLRVEKIVF